MNRDAAISLRAKPAQRDLIDQAASLLGKNRSDFMLEVACDKAQQVLLDQVFFRWMPISFSNLCVTWTRRRRPAPVLSG